VALWSCNSPRDARSGAADHDPACDPRERTPNGHLRACAAGTSSADGPGVPVDFAGHVAHAMALSPAERAAIDQANTLAERRRPRAVKRVDMGFGVDARIAGAR
jgi:hypothetical protein